MILVLVFMYILLCLIWGSTWLMIKIGLTDAPPFTTAAIRFMLAMTILGGISLVRGYRFPRKLSAALWLGYPGIYMYGLSYALIYFASEYITSSMTAVLFGAFPFFVVLFSKVLYGTERQSPLGWVGLVSGMSGVVLISYDSFQTSDDLFLGTILAIGGTLAAAYGMVVHKHRFVQENIVVASSVQMMMGGVLLVAGMLLFESRQDFNVTAASIGSIAYLAIVGTVIAFLGYYWLLTKMRAVTVSLIAFVTPLVAIFVGVLVAGEVISLRMILGTVLILSGIFLVVRKAPEEKERAQLAGAGSSGGPGSSGGAGSSGGGGADRQAQG